MKETRKQKRKSESLRNYARYSAIGFQMLAIIGGLTWLGVKMDEWVGAYPLFTVLLSLSSVGIALYAVIKQLKS
ncbi:putative F0F1-ATPase subunit (Ca2+/Mg2+ transporter) [Anseongella ginsenosidimutans]|uniref:Putative F0F1-ATPase subunit (Ca2+/Mg2+ transporter) n=1 Tax=Anseongella ginsenosidimutans TaxID=496056 RepID=A0A4R3KWI3_9SPHI|nr:AtpZ/AtpI family protein [Anseongella ginsenosidimutans]QEC51181.1 AtpZ/AtpI family protein [Anseongella ginsenosidimutans]TCS90147.1 putative F0F1-ATPase subunit (Ca2+/Mg2+ transporter) [Anseongella ginsenosidimutans]